MAFKTARLEKYLNNPAIAQIEAWYKNADGDEVLASLSPKDQEECEHDGSAAIGWQLFNLIADATADDDLADKLAQYIIRTRKQAF